MPKPTSQLLVFTTGTDLELLKASAERVMITLHVYDTPSAGYVTMKLRAAIDYLNTMHPLPPYLMWLDGNDSLLLRSEETILTRLGALGSPVIIAGEKTCWPDAERATEYNKMVHYDPGRLYINAGGFIGPTEQVMTAMHTAIAYATSEDDQRAWTSAYLAGALPAMQIDHIRWIFSCVGDGEEAIRVDSCSRHWNGRMQGRQEYWEGLHV